MIRRLFLPFVLLACFGVPYLLTQDDLGGRVQQWLGKVRGSNVEPTPVALPEQEAAPQQEPGQTITQVSAKPALAGTPVTDFGEVFRFDITPNWVLTRWTRVSTAPPGIELEGLRVPVVTGVAPTDIAGSLTYYFDREQVLQRITFQGTTGDPARLTTFVQQYYNMAPQESLDAALYMKKWNGKPISVLRVPHGAVVSADAPLTNFQVLLEINRPERGVKLSEPVEQLLEADRRGQRW